MRPWDHRAGQGPVLPKLLCSTALVLHWNAWGVITTGRAGGRAGGVGTVYCQVKLLM